MSDWWMLVPVLFGQTTIIVVFYLGLRSFERKMIALFDAKLQKSDALLFLTEQHTKLNEEYKQANLRMIQQVLAEQSQAKAAAASAVTAAEEVGRKVDQVPEATADKVMEKADKRNLDPDSGTRPLIKPLGTGDSHHG